MVYKKSRGQRGPRGAASPYKTLLSIPPRFPTGLKNQLVASKDYVILLQLAVLDLLNKIK